MLSGLSGNVIFCNGGGEGWSEGREGGGRLPWARASRVRRKSSSTPLSCCLVP